MDEPLTQEMLCRMMTYDPSSGVFVRRMSRGRCRVGSIAGTKNGCGYFQIRIGSKTYLSHRLAFLAMTGEIPQHVDHINGVKDDNRWANLRPASPQINARNIPLRITNMSGVSGVTYETRRGRWCANIKVSGKYRHLGYFDDWFDAVCARKSANNKYGYHPNHGRHRHV